MKRNPAERLCAYVLREHGRRLTARQLLGPWTYVGSRNGEPTGVVIDADGASPGHRIMAVDIEGEIAGFTTDQPAPLELA